MESKPVVVHIGVHFREPYYYPTRVCDGRDGMFGLVELDDTTLFFPDTDALDSLIETLTELSQQMKVGVCEHCNGDGEVRRPTAEGSIADECRCNHD